MKTTIGLTLLACALLPAAGALAQDNGPQGSPVQNINGYSNPTAPAQLPSTFTPNPMAPTYPSGGNGPASRGGTTGDNPDLRKDMPDPLGYRKQKLEREQALPEPNMGTHTATPPGDTASPGTPTDVNPDSTINPGAVQGGPQP